MNLSDMNILIVDDNEAQIVMLRLLLKQAGYRNISTLKDPRQVITRFETFRPDLILLDFHMPYMSGLEVLAELEPFLNEQSYVPVMMLTASTNPATKRAALAGGARDFLTKPYDYEEVSLRVRNLLEARQFHLQLKTQNENLEDVVRARTARLERTQVEMLVRLAHAAEYRDDETEDHVWRVAQNAYLLALELGYGKQEAGQVMRAARLHDVGKIGIPDSILGKPGRLNDEEFEVVKTHTTIGAKLLSGGDSPLVKLAATIALTHHERWDGTGYPNALEAENIPLEGRILAVVDTFDALTRDRVFQDAMSADEALTLIKAQSGYQFDPSVVAAFEAVFARGEFVHETARAAALTQF